MDNSKYKLVSGGLECHRTIIKNSYIKTIPIENKESIIEEIYTTTIGKPEIIGCSCLKHIGLLKSNWETRLPTNNGSISTPIDKSRFESSKCKFISLFSSILSKLCYIDNNLYYPKTYYKQLLDNLPDDIESVTRFQLNYESTVTVFMNSLDKKFYAIKYNYNNEEVKASLIEIGTKDLCKEWLRSLLFSGDDYMQDLHRYFVNNKFMMDFVNWFIDEVNPKIIPYKI
jgi:hypothetical protein